jgi:hypothetical protein
MTTKELNKAVKKLNEYIKGSAKGAEMSNDNTAYFKTLEEYCTPEFKRIIGADSSFKSFTADSLRILIKLNSKHRFVPFHQFGLQIED